MVVMRNHPARRLLIAGAFAAVAAIAPAAAHFVVAPHGPAPTSLAACQDGEIEDLYTDNCVPELTPQTGATLDTVSAPVVAGPNDSGRITESDPGDPQSLPEVDGVPITHPGGAIGLEESAIDNDIPVVVPRSTLSASP
jgi:hypothetical protein